MTWTAAACREAKHEACSGELVQSYPDRIQTWDRCACREAKHERCSGELVQSYPDRIQTWDRCACPCHARETAGIDMKEAFAR